MLFEQWNRAFVAGDIRDRLQTVGALIPRENPYEYFGDLRTHSYDVFSVLYDEIPPAEKSEGKDEWSVDHQIDGWNFDEMDDNAPHFPWAVKWNPGFHALYSLQERFKSIDPEDVRLTFGPLLNGIQEIID
jgi:hypothetical protein